MSTNIKAHQSKFVQFNIMKVKDQHLVFDIQVYPTEMSPLLKISFDANFSGIKNWQYDNFFNSCHNLKFQTDNGYVQNGSRNCIVAVNNARNTGFGVSRFFISDIEEGVSFDFTGFPVNLLTRAIYHLLDSQVQFGESLDIAAAIDLSNSATYRVTVRCDAENKYYGVSAINSSEFAKIRKIREELVAKAIDNYCEFSRHEVMLVGRVERNDSLEYHWGLYEYGMNQESITCVANSIRCFEVGVTPIE